MEENGSAGSSMDGSAAENSRPKPFRSWAEDYRPDEQPIDRAAFGFRHQQRGVTRTAATRAPAASQSSGSKAIYFAQRELASVQGQAQRASDPVLAAQLTLQRRGMIVYRASVRGPRALGWIVSGQPGAVSDDALVALAQAV